MRDFGVRTDGTPDAIWWKRLSFLSRKDGEGSGWGRVPPPRSLAVFAARDDKREDTVYGSEAPAQRDDHIRTGEHPRPLLHRDEIGGRALQPASRKLRLARQSQVVVPASRKDRGGVGARARLRDQQEQVRHVQRRGNRHARDR